MKGERETGEQKCTKRNCMSVSFQGKLQFIIINSEFMDFYIEKNSVPNSAL